MPKQTVVRPTVLAAGKRCMKPQANNKPKILVVDDEPDNLDLLYRTFHHDYKVLRAASGPVALEVLAKEGDIAVIISDQRMPQMSGTEFLSLTATQYPDIIRIILTGYTDVDDLVEAINTGKVFKYVTKPWEAEELKVLVRQALDTHNVLKTRTQELCRTLRQESLLNTVTNTIRSALDYRQILQTIVDSVGNMLEASCCILRPFQDDRMSDEWFIYQPSALKKSAAEPLQQFSERNGKIRADAFTFSQTVWETREVQVLREVVMDERIQGNTPELKKRASAYKAADICSSLVVPLICQQELMAVLALHQCGQPRLWQDDEVQLVLMVADQAALALSQARAYEQVRALAMREALINTITTAIRSSLDPQSIFAAITQRLGQALDVDGCVLSLWTEEDEFVKAVGLYYKTEEFGVESLGIWGSEGREFDAGVPTERRTTPQLPQSHVPIAGNPVLQELLKTQQPVVIHDLTQQPEMRGFALPLRASARALLVVPLLTDGKSIGSITCVRLTTPASGKQLRLNWPKLWQLKPPSPCSSLGCIKKRGSKLSACWNWIG